MFDDQGRAARREAIQRFINMSRGASQPAQELMLNVMACLNEAKIFGSIIDPKTYINMVFTSLNHSFSHFKLDNEQNHKKCTLKGKKKGKKGKKKSNANIAPKKVPMNKESKPKGKCCHRGKDEHWKRNCSIYLAEKKAEKGPSTSEIAKSE
ncbi:hypothetical protein Patl1_20461 [Pistacia atlantica]|uniref:Uncharacterized protein n=1 Tax=Pistacia atlantica TaxID=434234 RepID=A0ACC1BNB4_9ROSI|nr:hypothetical protein Patl1_20461 [Pistacia atlantica]